MFGDPGRSLQRLRELDFSGTTRSSWYLKAASTARRSGTWELVEPASEVEGVGGSGLFEASLKKAAVALPEECAALLAEWEKR